MNLKYERFKASVFIPRLIEIAIDDSEARIEVAIAHRQDCDAKIAELRSLIRSDKITRQDGRKLIFLFKKLSRPIDEKFFR